MIWHFNDITRAWALKQVTGSALSIEDRFTELSESEFSAYSPVLLARKPKTILDLACGIGRVSVFLNTKIKAHYYLADTTSFDKPKYGYNVQSFYNNLDATRDFCFSNHLVDFETIDVQIEKLPVVDCIISMLGIGFHVPIEQEIEKLHSVSKLDTLLIFGVGKENEQEIPLLTKWFSSQSLVPFGSKYHTHEGRVLILYGKI